MKIKIKDIRISELLYKKDDEYGIFVIYEKDEALKIKEKLQKIINQIDKELKNGKA